MIDLKELERKIDEAIANETPESIYEWLVGNRNKVSGKEHTQKMCGTLVKRQGVKGYHPCKVGHEVYETEDRYILKMTTVDGSRTVDIPYYKETLKPFIKL